MEPLEPKCSDEKVGSILRTIYIFIDLCSEEVWHDNWWFLFFRHSGLQQICDSYSLEQREYFFDRSPRNFDAILGLYRNGKLHLPAGVRKIHKDQVNHVKAPWNSEALYFSQYIFAGLRPGFLWGAGVLGSGRSSPGAMLPTHLLQGQVCHDRSWVYDTDYLQWQWWCYI